MDENVQTRVTRSLRKRLNSTESEPTLSRAGTPTRGGTPLRNLNLDTISEGNLLDSPSKGRGRRRSVNIDTVESKTPSKAAARLVAVSESPAVSSPRRTRRASFSQEDLKPVTPAKGRRLSAIPSLSKETPTESPKRGRPKAIKDEAENIVQSPRRSRAKIVKEELPTTASPKTVRNTRSATKSPTEIPKTLRSQTKSPVVADSELKSNESPKSLRSQSKSPMAPDSDLKSKPQSDVLSPKMSTSNEVTSSSKSASSNTLKVVTSSEDHSSKMSPKKERRSSSKSPNPNTPSRSPNTLNISPSTKVLRSASRSPNPRTVNISPTTMVLRSSSKSPNILNTSNEIAKDKSPKSNSSVRIFNKRLDMSKDNSSMEEKKSKSIQFIQDDDNDEREKTKYLKTPHISKNRSTMGIDNSADNSFELLDINRSKKNVCDNTTESLKSEDIPVDEIAIKTPHRNKLINMSSSTPIGISNAISTSKLELSLKEVSKEAMDVDKDVSVIPEEKEDIDEPVEMTEDSNTKMEKQSEKQEVKEILEIEGNETPTKMEEICNEKEASHIKEIEIKDTNKSSHDISMEKTSEADIMVDQVKSDIILSKNGSPEKTKTSSPEQKPQDGKLKNNPIKIDTSLSKKSEDEKLSSPKKQQSEQPTVSTVSCPEKTTVSPNKNIIQEQPIRKHHKTAQEFREEAQKLKEMIRRASLPSQAFKEQQEKAAEKKHSMPTNGIQDLEEKVSPKEGKIPSEEPKMPEEVSTKEIISSSWSTSVRRSATAKIDNFEAEPEEEVIKGKPRKPSFIVDGDDEEDDDIEEEEKEDKNSLLDDEAEEAGEDEDSMDEEEREYLAQNEIPEQGHSIGSEDSEEESCEEEDDDSFIVADSDVEEEAKNAALKIVSSDEDDLTDGTQPKKYKRIQRALESSDEENVEKETVDAENVEKRTVDEENIERGTVDEENVEMETLDKENVKSKEVSKIKSRKSMGPAEPMDVDEEVETINIHEDTFMTKPEKEALMINVTKFIDQDSESDVPSSKTNKTLNKTVKEDAEEESESEEEVICVSDDSDKEIEKLQFVGSPMMLRVSDSESGKDVKKVGKNISMTKKLRKSLESTDCKKAETSDDEEGDLDLNISKKVDTSLNSSRKSKRLSSKNEAKKFSDEEDEKLNDKNLNTSKKLDVSFNSSRKSKRFSSRNEENQSCDEDDNLNDQNLNSSKKADVSFKSRKSSKRLSNLNATNSKDASESTDSDKEELDSLKNNCIKKQKRYNKNNETLEDGELTDQENSIKLNSSKKTDNLNISQSSNRFSLTYQDEMCTEKPLPKRIAQQILHNSLNQSYGKFGCDELCSSEDDSENTNDEKPKQKLCVSFSEDLLKRKKKSDKSLLHKSHIGVLSLDDNEENKEQVSNLKRSKLSTPLLIEDSKFKPSSNRKSMSAIRNKDSKKIRRQSLSSDQELSSSFVNEVAKKKREKQQIASPNNEDIENQSPEKSPEQPKKRKQFNEHEILNACDLYLEAANLAKRQAMIQNKKTLKDKILQKKLEKKRKYREEKEKEEKQRVLENAIKKKKSKAIKKATVAALKFLDEDVEILVKKPSKMIAETNSRRLPEDVLNVLSENSSEKNAHKKTKKMKKTKSSSEEDSPVSETKMKKLKKGARFIKTPGGVFLEEPLTPQKPKKKIVEILKTRAGILKIEPLTPEEGSSNTSFRETDQTPKAIGFKVRQILSAGQKGGIPKLEPTKKTTKRKKALAEQEPSNVLPKPKWQKFEDVSPVNPLPKVVASSSSTQFSVMSNNNNNVGINLNALNFKTNALFNNNKIQRESAKAIAARKRKL